MRAVWTRTGLGIAVLALTVRAHANPAEAFKLFRDGRELMKAGDFEAACDRFQRSNRLAPKVGTLLNLGDCYAKRGKTASAWAAFVEAKALAAQTNDLRREAEALQRSTVLEPKLAYVMIAVDAKLEGLEIFRGSNKVDPATWNAAVPVDPGDYELRATAVGRVSWNSKEVAVPGRRLTVTVALAIDPAFKRAAPIVAPPMVVAKLEAVPIRTVGIGVGIGANTREHPLVGARIVGNLTTPIGVVRGLGSLVYSRYEDPGDPAMGESPYIADTFIIGGGFEYLFIPVPQLAFAFGAGFGMEIDRAAQTDVSGSLSLRASPIIVRLARGSIEAGLHAQLVIASDEIRVDVLGGADWFFR